MNNPRQEKNWDPTQKDVLEDKTHTKESAVKVNFLTVAQIGNFRNLLDSTKLDL
jgi:hypothetical protein